MSGALLSPIAAWLAYEADERVCHAARNGGAASRRGRAYRGLRLSRLIRGPAG